MKYFHCYRYSKGCFSNNLCVFFREMTYTNADVAEILKAHVLSIMEGSPNDVGTPKTLLNVRRNQVFKDSLRKILSSSFKAVHPLSVRFADDLGNSEGAVDLGGPTREFLRLACKEIFLKHVRIVRKVEHR